MSFEQWYIDEFLETLGEPPQQSDGIPMAEIKKLTKGKKIPSRDVITFESQAITG